MLSTPYLRATPDELKTCLLCDKSILDMKMAQRILEEGLKTLKDKACQWEDIDIPNDDEPYFQFTRVQNRLSHLQPRANLFAHKSCRVTFRSTLERLKAKYSQKGEITTSDEERSETPETIIFERKSTRHKDREKFICFICDTKTPHDEHKPSEGGLSRCSADSSMSKIESSMKKYIHSDHEHAGAAERLQLLTAGQAHDGFAADIYYHKNCYSSFNREISAEKEATNEEFTIVDKVMAEFFELFEEKVLWDKGAYLLTELLEDIKEMSSDHNLSEPIIRHVHVLKKRLQERFGDIISFDIAERKLIVHPTGVNPCVYAIGTLVGAGLRDDDLVKAFARMIKRKISLKTPQKWPLSPDELLAELDRKGPLPYLYNAIAWSKDPNRKKNALGFVAASTGAEAEKIWAISSDWESLISRERPAKSAALSLTIHRLTGSKEAVNLLHKCGHGIAYNDVRLLNNEWAKTVKGQSLPAGFKKGRPAHVTLDNSDGRQQTLTGAHTTHHTNGTVFQTPDYHGVAETIAVTKDPTPEETSVPVEEVRDYGFYKIPKKVSPPAVPEYIDEKRDDLLEWSLQRDVAWAVVSAIGKEIIDDPDIGPVGSWTTFMKEVTETETKQCVLQYLEVIPMPPNDTICKWYLDMILQMAEDLEVDCIFAHADEAVNCKLVLIQWLHAGRYDKIVTLLGGFHTLLVKLKILFKKYAVLGLKDWWVDSEAVAEGSAQQAIEGRHYARSIRLHKQSYEALLRTRISQIDVAKFEVAFKDKVTALRLNPNPDTLAELMRDGQFRVLSEELFTYSGTQSQMMTEYMKDVSHLLTLVSSVRENSIECHMQAERRLLPQLFAFGHPNYSRYLTYQHVTLQGLERTNPTAWNELKRNGFGGSLSGQAFSTEHGDLITETTINREVKVRGGPMQGGYSTNIATTDVFIKTSHLMAKVRVALKNKLHVMTSTVHKETTTGAKLKHEETVTGLVNHLKKLLDPFAPGEARNMKTGAVIDQSVIRGLLQSTDTGEKLLAKFVEERIQNSSADRVPFFHPITNPRIKTGMEKPKKEEKVLNILKEDKQAFGCLVGKAVSPEEAHSHPLTTVPLALAAPDKTLRQGNKASLRNHIIEESKAASAEQVPMRAVWIVDGMAAIRAVPPCDTWGDFVERLLQYCLPPEDLNPKTLLLIMDVYGDNHIKESAQKKRIEGQNGQRIHITSEHQSMPAGKDWISFLTNGNNKNELVAFIARHYKTPSIQERLPIPIVVTDAEHTWLISQSGIEQLNNCNHQEADTRIVYHAAKSSEPVVVQASDTDIFVLLLYAYVHVQPTESWCMRIEKHKYVDIGAVCQLLGEEVCRILPAYHSLTGCDTTSYPFNVGKVKPFKKMLTTQTEALLARLGQENHSQEDLQNELTFIQTNMYGGKPAESFLQTRIRSYERQKVKSSTTLLPDSSSATEHIKRADLQAYIWRQCMLPNIDYPSPIGRGWQRTEQGFEPQWYTCAQFPPCLSTKRPRLNKASVPELYSADCESNEDCQPQKKRRRRRQNQLPPPVVTECETSQTDSSKFSGEWTDDAEDSEWEQ